MAQSGHAELHCTCPLSGVKRTWRFALQMSAFDPKRTFSVTPSYPQSAISSGKVPRDNPELRPPPVKIDGGATRSKFRRTVMPSSQPLLRKPHHD